MNKTLLLVAALFTFGSALQAQFKQAGGERNLQLLFNPISVSGSPVLSLNNGLSFRQFNATGTAAWRVAVTVGSNMTTAISQQEGDTLLFPTQVDFGNYKLNTGRNPFAEQRTSTFTFGIRPGYEKHFAGTDRLSPYVGGEVVFGMSMNKIELDLVNVGDYSVVFTNDPGDAIPVVNATWTTNTLNSKSRSTTLGLNLVAGFDFYFAKNLSLGAEVNFGYYLTSFSDMTSEYIKNTVSSSSVLNPNTFITTTTVSSSNTVAPNADMRQGGNSGFGPGVLGFLKLGWLF